MGLDVSSISAAALSGMKPRKASKKKSRVVVDGDDDDDDDDDYNDDEDYDDGSSAAHEEEYEKTLAPVPIHLGIPPKRLRARLLRFLWA